MELFRKLAPEIVKRSVYGSLGFAVISFTWFGLFAFVELTDRDRRVAEIEQELSVNDRAILDNLQLTDDDLGILENAKKEPKNASINIKITGDLIQTHRDLTKELDSLKRKIRGSPRDGKMGADQPNDNEGWFRAVSTNALLSPLILLAAVTGAIVHFLREPAESGTQDGIQQQKSNDIIERVLISLVSGIGVGILCFLFLATGADAIHSSFSIFPALSVSMKVLIAFLAGLFMKELYAFLANWVPTSFRWIVDKLPIGKKGENQHSP